MQDLFILQLEVCNFSFSIAAKPEESRETRPKSTVCLTSQRHPEKLLEVTGTSRGNTGFPAANREKPLEAYFNVS